MLFGVYIYGAYLMLGLQENGCEGKCLWQVLSKSDEKSEIKNLFCKEKPSFDDNIWCDMMYCYSMGSFNMGKWIYKQI